MAIVAPKGARPSPINLHAEGPIISSTDQTRLEWENYEEAHPIIVPAALDAPHAITSNTASARGWGTKPPPEGQVPDWSNLFDVTIYRADPQRALRLIDAILKACEARGFELRYDAKHAYYGVTIFIENEPVALRLVERGSRVTFLSLETGRSSPRHKWKDSLRRPLEKRLNEIMIELRAYAAKRITTRRELEEMWQRYQERERQRTELREQIEDEQEAVEALRMEAANWQEAKTLRAYIATVEQQPVSGKQRAKRREWSAWARDQADRLDPLTPSPPSILDTPFSRYRELGHFEVLDEDGNIA